MKNSLLITVLLFTYQFSSGQTKFGYLVNINNVEAAPDSVVVNVDSTISVFFPDSNVTNFFSNFELYEFGLSYSNARTAYMKECYRIVSTDSTLDSLIHLFDSVRFYDLAKIMTYELLYTPNDFLTPTSFAPSHLELIGAEAAWDITKGSSSISILIPDRAFDVDHEDLSSKIHASFPYAGFPVNMGINQQGHGTAVAGAAAGHTDNQLGISSIGFNTTVVVINVVTTDLSVYLPLIDMYPQIKVFNISFGGCMANYDQPFINKTQGQLNEFYAKGITVVAAAGNGNLGPCPTSWGDVVPASLDHVISVTSVGHINDIAPGVYDNLKDVHSKVGIAHPSTHNHNVNVDICAPGYDVPVLQPFDQYVAADGSSFATPMVAGSCALLYSINSCFTPGDIEYLIKSTAVDIYQISYNSLYAGLLGAGRLDIGAATLKAAGGSFTINTGITETWNDPHFIDGTLLIKNGGFLTITNNVYFKPNAKIIVENGGKLMVNGGHLTGYCDASGTKLTWAGIEVWGDPLGLSSSSTQGAISLINATISNALCGIVTGDNVGNTNTGGFVECFNSKFINCRIGINFKPFGDPTRLNFSLISECEFLCDELLYSGNGLNHHISIVENYGIRIVASSFINTSGNAVNNDRGRGIQCIDGSFKLFGASPSGSSAPDCEMPEYIKNTFEGLSHGVKTLDFYPPDPLNEKYTIISESNYKNCGTGVWVNSEGVKKINRNFFFVNENLNPQLCQFYYNSCRPIGILALDAGNLLIDSNHSFIDPSYNKPEGFVGLQIVNSANSNDASFLYMNHNQVSNAISTPIELLGGINQSIGFKIDRSNDQLDIACNTFERLNTDFYFDVDPAFGEVILSPLPNDPNMRGTDILSDYNTMYTYNALSFYHLTPSGSHQLIVADVPAFRNFNIINLGGSVAISGIPEERSKCLLTNRCAIHESAATNPGQQEPILEGGSGGGGDGLGEFSIPKDKIFKAILDNSLLFNSNDTITYKSVETQYILLMSGLKESGRQLNELNGEELSTLKQIASVHSAVQIKAKALLELNEMYQPYHEKEIQTRLELLIIPNPNEGLFRLKYKLAGEAGGTIRIVNSLGQSMKMLNTYEAKGEIEINGSFWSPGIYFVTLTDSSGNRVSEAFVIK